jgi:hypothetical protein
MNTREEILYYFRYDKEQGKLFWQNHYHGPTIKKLKGKEAGAVNGATPPYRYIMLNEKNYPTHVLIFLIEHNYRPFQIDHLDGNSLNNKIGNLKACHTQNQNQRNKIIHRKGRLPGVYFCNDTNRWRARVRIKNVKICLGRFDTEEQAYLVAKDYLESKGVI